MKKDLTESVVENPVGTSRRQFIKKTAAATVMATAGPVILQKYARAAARPIKIGFVTPRTGAIAAFAACDDFVLSHVRKAVSGGIMVNGANHPIEIIVKDSQSNQSRAAQVAAELIKSDKVDLLVTACHVDTIAPVSDQAEINGVPCIVTDCPWQLLYVARGVDFKKVFDWSYLFFWGLDDDEAVFLDIWDSLPTNRVVGALWGNDASGLGFSNPEHGFPPGIKAKGFKLVDPGRFSLNISDFSAQIQTFKQAQAEIVVGEMPAGLFDEFWIQAAQQRFKPKIVTISAGILFPSAVDALTGDSGAGLTTEINWSPEYPYKSGLTGQTAAQLCAQWEQETGKQWTQPIGHKHALFEVAIDVLKRTKNIDSPQSIRDAILASNYNSVVGHLQWNGQPTKNVCKTALCAGQWVKGKKYKYDLDVVSNIFAKEIPKHPLQPV